MDSTQDEEMKIAEDFRRQLKTWGKDAKSCKTPHYFFEEKVYDEDPAS